MTPRFTIWSFGRNLRTTSPAPHLQALTTTLEQTRQDWEMLLVDDASEDGTGSWLRAQPGLMDRRITFVTRPERRGKMQNFIDLFPRFRGEIAVELDADDWWCDADALAKIAACYDAADDVDCTLGRYKHATIETSSGPVPIAAVGRPRALQISPALRTWRVSMMRDAVRAYPDAFIDPFTGEAWSASADHAISQLATHCARRVVDLGSIVYVVNDHAERDERIHSAEQRLCNQRILSMWIGIKNKEAGVAHV